MTDQFWLRIVKVIVFGKEIVNSIKISIDKMISYFYQNSFYCIDYP